MSLLGTTGLYVFVLAAVVVGAVVGLRARSLSIAWLGLSMVYLYLENSIAFGRALAGSESHAWMLHDRDAAEYIRLVALSVGTTLVIYCLFAKRQLLPRFVRDTPPLAVQLEMLSHLLRTMAWGALLTKVLLLVFGYDGYFMAEEVLNSPPPWIGLVKMLISIGLVATLILLIYRLRVGKSLRTDDWVLILAWAGVGVLSGFKTEFARPFLLVFVAGWVTRKPQYRHLLLFILALFLSYAIIEPMRGQRRYVGSVRALDAVGRLNVSRAVESTSTAGTIERVAHRLDYSLAGIEAVRAARLGAFGSYKERLDDVYSLWPVLAVVPGFLWPDKPRADLGRDMSVVLTRNENSAVTPSRVVQSYLWKGELGVVLLAMLTAVLSIVAGQTLQYFASRPLAYAPMLVLFGVLAMPSGIVGYQLVKVLRVSLGIAAFYWIARSKGWVRRLEPGIGGNSGAGPGGRDG